MTGIKLLEVQRVTEGINAFIEYVAKCDASDFAVIVYGGEFDHKSLAQKEVLVVDLYRTLMDDFDRIKQQVIDALYGLYINSWCEDEPMTPSQFVSPLALSLVTIHPDNDFSVSFNIGEAFQGHGVTMKVYDGVVSYRME